MLILHKVFAHDPAIGIITCHMGKAVFCIKNANLCTTIQNIHRIGIFIRGRSNVDSTAISNALRQRIIENRLVLFRISTSVFFVNLVIRVINFIVIRVILGHDYLHGIVSFGVLGRKSSGIKAQSP